MHLFSTRWTRYTTGWAQRRMETDDAIELAMKKRGASDQPAPSLNEPGFQAEVMKEPGGRFGSKETDPRPATPEPGLS